MRELLRLRAFIGAGALVGLAFMTSPSRADILQESVPVYGQFTNPNTGATGFSVVPPSFDTSLGTLTDVSLDLKGSFIAQGFYQFASLAPVPPPPDNIFPFTTIAEVSFGTSRTTITPITISFDCTSNQCYSNPFNNIFPFEITRTLPASDFLPSGSFGYFFVDGGLDLPTALPFLATVPGSSFGEDTSYIVGTLTLDFTFTPANPSRVPEPASLPLLGVGLIGMGAIARRAKRDRPAASEV